MTHRCSATPTGNRALGLPAVQYRSEPLPGGGTAVWATAKLNGLTLRWREWPFEWSEPEFHLVRRDFSTGPLAQFIGGVNFPRRPTAARACASTAG